MRHSATLVFVLSLGVLLSPATADAGPILLARFQGIIPTLTVTRQEQVISPATGPVTTTVTVQHNVPFSATATFDAAILAQAALYLPPGSLPFRQFVETDPSTTTAPDTGVTTDEWLRGTVFLDGTTLEFSRHLVDSMPAGSTVSFPYAGVQSLFYLEGSEAEPLLGFEAADAFGLSVSNNFAYFTPNAFTGPFADGETFFASEGTFLSFGVGTGVTPDFQVVDLFGPGAPVSFVWEDATPALCSTTCDEYFTLFGSLYHLAGLGVHDGGGQLTSSVVEYRGDLVLNRLEVQAVAAPEPGTLALLGIAGGAAALKRRRQFSRPRPSN